MVYTLCKPSFWGYLKGNFLYRVNEKYTKAPHTIFTQFLDDGDCEEREAGIEMGVQLLVKCDELWSFGEKISEGMAAEIAAAKVLGITVKRFNDKCEPLEVKEGNGEDKR